jgi:hypothetical protein
MYSTTAYIYQQIQRILLIDTSGEGETFVRRWEPVYAKKLTINKGVDNVILFEFVNQDQKPVNITGSNLIFRLINLPGDVQLLEKPMVILNAATGRAKVTLSAADTTELPTEPASYSIDRTSGTLTEAVFVDAQAQARADVDIQDSVLPAFVPSHTVTVPTIYGPEIYVNPVYAGNYPDWALNPPPVGNVQPNPERYSSFIPTNGSNQTTFQLTFDHYTGNIKAQAAENYQSTWYDVTNIHSFYNKTGVDYINVVGYYPLLRLDLNSYSGAEIVGPATANAQAANGVITGITVTNAGNGYLAPPKVSIVGLGAGAVAEAEITGGQVSAINVINGGQGYTPSPAQPTVPAAVFITTGAVTDIIVR